MSTTKFKVKELPEAVVKELSSSTHDFSLLNGEADAAKEFIAFEKAKSPKEIPESLKKLTGNVMTAMAFDNLEEKEIKEVLMPHMHPLKIKEYLETKDEKRRTEIISQVVNYLEKIDSARATSIRMAEKVKEATVLINSTKEVLSQITNGDPEITQRLLSNLTLLGKEKDAKHPSETVVLDLISKLQKDSSELIGSEQLLEARKGIDDFIVTGQKTISEDDIPTEVKDYFNVEFNKLKTLKEGSNPFAMKASTERLGKELYEKTSKEIRAQAAAVFGQLKVIQRFLLAHLFTIDINGKSYNAIVDILRDETIVPTYEKYTSGLGRFGKAQNPVETFDRVLKGGLGVIIAEIKIVHEGNENIEDVSLPAAYLEISSKVDSFLSEIQARILKLSTNDLVDAGKRLASTKQFLADLKGKLKDYFKIEQGLEEIHLKDLVDGPLFTTALSQIPATVSGVFTRIF